MGAPNPLVSDRVFGGLLEAVLTGRYGPGERLPTQRALAADLGVTLSSLREALKRLEQMGVLDVRHGDATYVRDWRAHGGLDVLAHVLLLGGRVDAGVLHAILEARSLLLREMAGLAAGRRTDGHVADLGRLAGELAAAADPGTAARVDFAFMTVLAEAAGNLVFVLILNAIRDLYLPHADAIPVTARPQELAPRYARIAAAVGEGRAEAAREAMWRLAEAQRVAVEGLLGGAPPSQRAAEPGERHPGRAGTP